MTHYTNVPTAASVHDDGAVYTASGMRVASAEVRATAIAEQAGRWLTFATERTRMKPATITAKALQSTSFSVLHGAASFAVPSKLSGTSKHQRALWALVRDPGEPWAVLDLDVAGEGITASHDGEPLGLVQPKHLGWVRPLISFGLTAHLGRVTGHDYEGYSLGCNVCFGHVGTALDGLLAALGSGDGAGDGAMGDGQHGGPEPVVSPAAVPSVSVPSVSDVRPVPALRLAARHGVPVHPEHAALGADPDDVVLYRHVDGTACATVDHVVRHSPTGVEWGYGGSGPADLALSVLRRLTDEATADRLYQAFKAEVVAGIPSAGGVIRAVDVRAWVAAQAGR